MSKRRKVKIAIGRQMASGILGSGHHYTKRIAIVMIFFLLGYGIIFYRLGQVSLVKQDDHEDIPSFIADFSGGPKRLAIVDRNGLLLAVNLTTASVYADPAHIIDAEDAAKRLHQVFPKINVNIFQSKLSSKKRFVWIQRNIGPRQQHAINQLGIPGVYFKNEESRVYTQGNVLSHVIGFTGVDGKGLAGVEKYFDSSLSRQNSNIVSGLGHNSDGLRLSLDLRVQSILHEALSDSMNTFRAKGAGGIVYDVVTGEIIAMSSLPDFDPHNPGHAIGDELFNRMTLGVYEMGSTFKTLNMAMALESGKISMQDEYDVSQPIDVANFTIRDYHPRKGMMSVPDIFIYSSNIGSAHIATDVGQEEQKSFLKRLGMLDELKMELPERSKPLYPSNWGKVNTMTISYGHGIAVTPLHLTQAVAAMVNGGMLTHSTLLSTEHSDSNNNDVEKPIQTSTQEPVRVISKATSDQVRKLMRFAVEHGTGKRADVPGYLVGGKTGSADKPNQGSYGKNMVISSFIGSFPMHKPRYVVLAMVDEPQSTRKIPYVTGGVVAAPIVGQVIEAIAPILGILPVNKNDYNIRREFWYKHDRQKNKATLASL